MHGDLLRSTGVEEIALGGCAAATFVLHEAAGAIASLGHGGGACAAGAGDALLLWLQSDPATTLRS